MTGKPPIVLASESKARRALLDNAGIVHTATTSGVDERAVEAPLIDAGATPAEIATALADAKALAVSNRQSDAIVIGGDQVLECDGARWVKPASRADARAQLARLSGRTHHLHTAVSAARGGEIVWRHSETAALTMRLLSDAFIDTYLDRVGDAALTTVGAYQIEGLGIQLFERIEGDTYAILGLPLLPLLNFLRREGAIE